jgi:23S rRNA (pseudouridine1915-N3)-methyltransferase
MQRVIVLAVGKIKTSWIEEGSVEYAKRLGRDVALEIVEIPASKERDPNRQKEDESERLLNAMKKMKGETYLLDERGERMRSVEIADLLTHARDGGKTLVFVIGGAYGLTAHLRAAARGSIRMSDMTFPHELSRLLLLEQLYRGIEIAKGSGYHH